MSSRRTFGSIRKTSSGRWQARYQAPDGRYRPAPHTFQTRAEADRWLGGVAREIHQGSWSDPALRSTTLETYAAEWLPVRPLAMRTRELYAELLKGQVLPDLGSYPLRSITPATVRKWHSDVSKRTGPTRTRQAYSLLRTILNTAKDDGLTPDNPCKIKGAGQMKAPERPLISPDLMWRLADAMDAHLQPAVVVTFFGALRLGELLGLQRGDLDLKAGTLSVQRQVVKVAGQRHVQPPKAASRRTVHLPEPALEVLRAYLTGQPLALPTAPLFTCPDGSVLEHHHLRASWNRARAAIGRPDLHFHDLRHGGLTLVAMTGVTLREIMGHAGHSTVAAAMNYQHVAESRGAEIAARLGQLGERRAETS